MHMCSYTFGGQRTISGIILQVLPIFFYEILAWNLSSRMSLRDLPDSAFPALGLPVHAIMSNFKKMDFEDQI